MVLLYVGVHWASEAGTRNTSHTSRSANGIIVLPKKYRIASGVAGSRSSAFFAWGPLPGDSFVRWQRHHWAAPGFLLPFLAIPEECKPLFPQSLSVSLRQALIG